MIRLLSYGLLLFAGVLWVELALIDRAIHKTLDEYAKSGATLHDKELIEAYSQMDLPALTGLFCTENEQSENSTSTIIMMFGEDEQLTTIVTSTSIRRYFFFKKEVALAAKAEFELTGSVANYSNITGDKELLPSRGQAISVFDEETISVTFPSTSSVTSFI